MPRTIAYGKSKNTDPNCLNEETMELMFFRAVSRSFNKVVSNIKEKHGEEEATKYRDSFSSIPYPFTNRRQ